MKNIEYGDLEETLVKAQEGSKEHKEKVLERYMKYIYKKAFMMNLTAVKFEDLVSVGTMTVLQCILKFDKDKHSNFTSYVVTAINNNLLDYQMTTCRKTMKDVEMDEAADEMIGEEHPQDQVLLYLEIQELRKALKSLSQEERLLIDSIYYKQKSLKATGEALGVSYVTVVNRRNRILKKLLMMLS